MPNHEVPVPAPARDSSVDVNFTERTHSSTSDNFSSNNGRATIETKHEESLEEYIEKFTEAAKKKNALNDQSFHDSLVAGAEWSQKHHGEVIDLSDIDP